MSGYDAIDTSSLRYVFGADDTSRLKVWEMGLHRARDSHAGCYFRWSRWKVRGR